MFSCKYGDVRVENKILLFDGDNSQVHLILQHYCYFPPSNL